MDIKKVLTQGLASVKGRTKSVKLSIGAKIFLGFTVVLLLLAVNSAAGITIMSDINNNVRTMETSTMPSLTAIGKLNVAISDTYKHTLSHMLQDDRNRKIEIEQQLNQAMKQVEHSLMDIQPFVATEETQELIDNIETNFALYKEGLTQILAESYRDQLWQAKLHLESYNPRLQAVMLNVSRLYDQNLAAASESVVVVRQDVRTGTGLVAAIAIAAAVAGLFVAFGIWRMITVPVSRLEKQVTRIAQGDLTVEPLVIRNKDELGRLADSFNIMTASLKQMIEEVAGSANRVSSTSDELTLNAEQCTQGMEQIAEAVGQVAEGADMQSASTREAADTVEEIAKGVEQVAYAIENVSDLSASANDQAMAGEAVVERTIGQIRLVEERVGATSDIVNELGAKSGEVGRIVSMISEIANQTNLLALNASIEAARAGEHGRGFAVVAEEVKRLAEQSKTAADEVNTVITSIRKEVAHAVHSMGEGRAVLAEGIQYVADTGEAFRSIVSMVADVSAQSQEVSAVVEQVSAGARGMLAAINNVAVISGQTSGNTQHVAAAAQQQNASMEEIAASAESLRKLAGDMESLISRFKLAS